MVDFGKGHKDYPVRPLAFGMAYQGLADRKAGPTVAAMPQLALGQPALSFVAVPELSVLPVLQCAAHLGMDTGRTVSCAWKTGRTDYSWYSCYAA